VRRLIIGATMALSVVRVTHADAWYNYYPVDQRREPTELTPAQALTSWTPQRLSPHVANMSDIEDNARNRGRP
jgi:hypothetical protein